MLKNKTAVDMTTGSILQRIITFAIPVFLGNLFQQLYNTADSLIVGNFLGKEALAAVSSSGSLIFMLVGFFGGISVGAGVVISRYFGAKNDDQLRRAVHTAVAFGIAAGVLLTAIGVPLTRYMLQWMGTPEKVLPQSTLYFKIYFSGVIASVMYNIAVGILQAVGDSFHPLLYLIVSSCVNIALDLLFVGVFGFGVGSAALATIISQFISAVLAFTRLIRVKSPVQVHIRQVRFNKGMLREIISMGIPTGVQNSIIGFANVIVQSHINDFGEVGVAGCGAYFKIEGFAFLPITCFAMALTTFISQNLGARQYDRAKRGAKLGVLCSVSLAEVIGVLIFTLSPLLVKAFNRDPEVVSFGVRQAHTEALFYCFLAFSHCIAGIMRGAGKAIVPMLVMMICWCAIRVSYITVITKFVSNPVAVFWAYPITWTLSSAAFLFCFFKTDWIHGFEKKAAVSEF